MPHTTDATAKVDSSGHPDQTQPQKHETDRRFERRTALLAAAIAALVALLIAGASFGGLAWSVHNQIRSAGHRDDRTFRHQQEVAALNPWFQAAAAIDTLEIDYFALPTIPGATVPTPGNIELEVQNDVLKLFAQTNALQLFVSSATFKAAQDVVQLHNKLLNQLREYSSCADVKGHPPANCDHPSPITPQQVNDAEQHVLDLVRADLKS